MKWLSAISVGAIELESTNPMTHVLLSFFFTLYFSLNADEIFKSTFWPTFSVWFTYNSNLLTKT